MLPLVEVASKSLLQVLFDFIAINQSLSGPLLATILANQFVEVVIAPAVDDAAVEVAKQKKNVRLLVCGALDAAPRGREFKRVGGGLLVQDADELCLDEQALKVVTQTQPDEAQMRDLLFAWKVSWFTKSNAIVWQLRHTLHGWMSSNEAELQQNSHATKTCTRCAG